MMYLPKVPESVEKREKIKGRIEDFGKRWVYHGAPTHQHHHPGAPHLHDPVWAQLGL